MKKIIPVFVFVMSFSFLTYCFAQYGNETITITTYYPSPHGVYGVLTMYPRDTVPDNPQQGDMYFNSGNNTLLIYANQTAEWQPVGGKPVPEYKDGDVFYNQTDKISYVYNSTSNTWIKTPSYKDGDVFYNQIDKKYYVYNSVGNTWIEIPSPGGGGGGNVITISGSNPTCPSGATEMQKYWPTASFPTCYYYATPERTCTVPGAWSVSAPSVWNNCGFSMAACGDCVYGGTTGTCTCYLQNWSMVMCQQ